MFMNAIPDDDNWMERRDDNEDVACGGKDGVRIPS